MKVYITKLSQISNITSLAFIIVGIFLMIKPATTLSLISYVLGLIILLNGIVTLIKYFSNREKINLYDFGLIFGSLNVVVAIVFISRPSLIASIIPLILGVWILVNGIIKLQFAINMRNYPNANWIRSTVIASVNVLLGLFLVLNPFKGAVVITRIIGGILIGYAVLDLLQAREMKKVVKDGVEFIK